jgi:hypothetical protein
MRKMVMGVLGLAGLTALAGCGGGKGGVMGHAAPDEFAVQRRAPLVIPPDFALTPPRPGAPRPQEADSSTLALQAMFGGQAARSESEGALTTRAGSTPDAGIRSTAGDPNTTVVDKGGATRDILSAPESTGTDATASVPK